MTVVLPPRIDPQRRARGLARYEQVTALRAQGWTHRAIVHEPRVYPRTLGTLAWGRNVTRAQTADAATPSPPMPPILAQRCAEGSWNRLGSLSRPACPVACSFAYVS
jgi:hypothetical protein